MLNQHLFRYNTTKEETRFTLRTVFLLLDHLPCLLTARIEAATQNDKCKVQQSEHHLRGVPQSCRRNLTALRPYELISYKRIIFVLLPVISTDATRSDLSFNEKMQGVFLSHQTRQFLLSRPSLKNCRLSEQRQNRRIVPERSH